MHIHCLGLNHNTAPIHLREQLVFSDEQVRATLARFNGGEVKDTIAELIIISTCNRIEIYAVSNSKSCSDLENLLFDAHGVPVTKLNPHLYHYTNSETIRHLFKVAAGLDSLVIGEPQILGQVAHSLELARAVGTTGPLLSRLFQAAVRAGKRVRTETGIGRNPASVSSLAASLSQRVVHHIAEAQIVILGAGEMAELAVEALRKRGANRILVVNRTLERAHALAQRWNAEASTFENLNFALISADILISSTGAPHKLISYEMVREAMTQRAERPLVLIDIAMPRDIDPETANIHHVRLYDMDGLNAQLETSLAERMAEVPQVKSILEDEISEFAEYLKTLEMLPIIADMRQQAEAIRQVELDKTLRHLPGLTEAERQHIEAMTQALVKKLLHAPTNRLRAEAASPHASEYAAVARTLFNLSDERTYPTSTAAD